MQMIKSPLRYPGGKSRAVTFLKNFIPDYKEYREVFFGGGSLCFDCVQSFKNKKYSASDLNFELFCFWSELKENGNKVIQGVQEIYDACKVSQLKGEDSYEDGKKVFNTILDRRNHNLTNLQRAIDFYVLNRITFSGVVDSGGYSQGSFEGRFTQSSIDRLYKTIPIIQTINFFCEDSSFLINQQGEDVFIFLDPPYYTATKSKLYGKKGILHTSFNHHALFKTLSSCSHKWMMTYDNNDYIKYLYKDFFIIEWKLQYGMTNRNNSASILGNELLIANYDLNKMNVLKKPQERKNKVYETKGNISLLFER